MREEDERLTTYARKDESDLVRAALGLRDSGRLRRAAEVLERAVDDSADDPLAWYWLAVTLDNLGRESRATFCYRRAMYAGLDDPALEANAWAWLGSSLCKTGFPDEALGCFERAEALGYPTRELVVFRTRARRLLGRPRRMPRRGLKAALAREVLRIRGIVEHPSQYSPTMSFWVDGKEFLHFDSSRHVELRLTREAMRSLRGELNADPRVRIRGEGIEFALRSGADLPDLLRLVSIAAEAHTRHPGEPARRSPAEVVRRVRRMHVKPTLPDRW